MTQPSDCESPAPPSPVTATGGWTLALQRVAILYFGLLVAADVAIMIPGVRDVRGWIGAMGARLLLGPGVTESPPTGSGDRAVSWGLAAVVLVAALLGGALWSALPRHKPRNRKRLHALTLLLVRLHLGLTLISYAAVKVLKSQFPYPTPVLLSRDLGDSSPMGLLWKFMGYSPSYTIFTGGVELLAGALLLFRRTRLLGGLLAAGVMANVVMLNLSYDVAVKLGSSQLLLMALFIIAADRRRLLGLLVPAADKPWPAGRARTAMAAVLGLLVVFALGMTAMNAHSAYYSWGDGREHHPRYGSYEVVEHHRGAEVLAQAQCDERYHRVHIHDEHLVVQTALGASEAFTIREHTNDTLRIATMPRPGAEGSAKERRFRVTTADDGQLTLREDAASAQALQLVLRRKRYRLNKRDFHWVSEAPFNR